MQANPGDEIDPRSLKTRNRRTSFTGAAPAVGCGRRIKQAATIATAAVAVSRCGVRRSCPRLGLPRHGDWRRIRRSIAADTGPPGDLLVKNDLTASGLSY